MELNPILTQLYPKQMSLMTNRIVVLMIAFLGYCDRTKAKPPVRNYLPYVQSFADSLLKYGLDRFGSRQTAQWASVIDTRTGAVPRKDVVTVAGIRPHDRAVGGSNAYQDLATIRAFRVLSDLTGREQYRRAADDYLRDVLQYTQSEVTGLLGWGEHLFYDLYEDRVRADSAFALRPNGNGGYYHEFLVDTPPWMEFWRFDTTRTARAIRGLNYHFWTPDAGSFLFNRHAHWDKTVYQPQAISQPWIKHSGLQAYSYAFLYYQTGDPDLLRRAEGSGSLYWNSRNPMTGLTPSCIGDKRPEAQATALSGTALLSYYLVKSSQWVPPTLKFREKAGALLTAAEHYCWDETRQTYRAGKNTDGQGSPPPPGRTNQTHLTAWVSGYGTANLLETGRIAATLARLDSTELVYKRMAERCARAAQRETPPDTLVAENVGDGIHLFLDLYDLTGQPNYLKSADDYAQLAIRHLWRNGWFVRWTGDSYYEAKLGIGTVVSGLLRLHRQQNPPTGKAGQSFTYDWSK